MNRLFSQQFHGMAVIITGILQISFFLFCTVLVLYHVLSGPESREETQKPEYYASVQVHSGESLWDISKRYYTSEYKSIRQYIRKIKYLNHMADEDLHAGAYLIIPYYE